MGEVSRPVGVRGNLSGLGVGEEDLTGLGDRPWFAGGFRMGEASRPAELRGNLSGLRILWDKRGDFGFIYLISVHFLEVLDSLEPLQYFISLQPGGVGRQDRLI